MPAMSQHVLRPNTLSIFAARRCSGKTTLMLHLLKTLCKSKSVNWVLVISPTAFCEGVWSEVVGAEHVREEFDENELESILAQQAAIRSRGGSNPGLLILDDCLGSVPWNSPIWTRIATAGRHFEISVWTTSQYYYKLPCVLRSNADALYIMGSHPDRVVKSIYDENGGLDGCPTWQAFRELVKSGTVNYGCLVLEAKTQALRTIRAPSRPTPFKIEQ